MRHWSGLVYLVAGVIIGLLAGASLTGMAAGGDEPARGDNHPQRYTLAYSDEPGRAVFDTQTGMLYRFSWYSPADEYRGAVVNVVEGWWEYLAVKKRVAPEPASE